MVNPLLHKILKSMKCQFVNICTSCLHKNPDQLQNCIYQLVVADKEKQLVVWVYMLLA